MLELLLGLGWAALALQDPAPDPALEAIRECAEAFPNASKADRLQWIAKLARSERAEVVDALLWIVQGIEAEIDLKLPEPETIPERIPMENPSNLRWPLVWRGFAEMQDKSYVTEREETRAAAVAALAAFRKEESFLRLLAILREHESAAQREAALQALAGAPAREDIDKQLPLAITTDRSWRVRAAVVDLIVAREDRNLAYCLKSAIVDPAWQVRLTAIRAIPKVGDPNLLIVGLSDPQWELRIESIRTIERIGHKAAVPNLLEAVQDPAWTVREAALRALGTLGSRTIVRYVMPALRDEAEPVRLAVIDAIRRAAGRKGLRALVEAFDNDNPNVKAAAVAAIVQINHKLAVNPILERADRMKLKDLEMEFQEALERLAGERKRNVREWSTWWDTEFRKAAAEFDTFYLQTKTTTAKRLEIIGKLAFHDRKETCERLFKVLGFVEMQLQRLLPEKDKMLNDQQSMPTHNQGAVRIWNAFHAKQRQLQDQLTELYKQWAAALDALSDFGSADCIEWMTRRLSSSQYRWEREGLAEALGGADARAAAKALIDRVDKDKEWTVRVIAIDSLVACYAPEAFDALLKALDDPIWHVRLAALLALEQLVGKNAVKPLIDRLNSNDGRLHGEIQDTLTRLTGITKLGKPESWQKWWEQSGAEFLGTKRRGVMGDSGLEEEGRKPTFYGFTVTSKRVIFILDISGSMLEAAEWKPEPAPKVPTDKASKPDPNAGDKPAGDRKIDVAQYELRAAIRLLSEDTLFNVILFSYGVKVWQPTLVPATAANRQAAIQWINSIPAWGGTNTFDSLEMAFSIKGPPQDKKRDQGADTFFFVSDGRPSVGRILDPDAILQEIGKINRTRRVRINTVAVGKDDLQRTDSGGGVDPEFLRKLAAENFGQTVWRK
jgi:HEAT repeat protein